MDLRTICSGCMQEKGDVAECPFCGWVDGLEEPAPQHLKPGTLLQGKYLIGRVLGQGGFGVTYLGLDINLKLKLAIKEYLPQDLATRNAGNTQVSVFTSSSYRDQFEYGLEKFLQEAQTLAQFEGHPNIVSVRDFFRENDTAYIVMSYVEGITLKEHLALSGNKLNTRQALSIISPVLDALSEVHAVNILHRDISTDNIFINQKGQVILIDFGAARQAISDKGRSLSIILKPGYTPEEQYRSKGVQGPWTDIYAVGVTLYRMLTGQMPPESLDRLAEDNLVPPSQLGVEISADEEAALLKALAVKAENRFQSARDFQMALLGQESLGTVQTAQAQDNHSFTSPPPINLTEQVTTRSTAEVIPEKVKQKTKSFLRIALYSAAGLGVLFFILIIAAIISGNGDQGDESKIYSVPGDYESIQDAIDKVSDGAEIVIAEGIYYENINFNGKNIVLRSSDPDNPDVVEKTIIDGGGNGPTVIFNSGENQNAILRGLYITGGIGVKEFTEIVWEGENKKYGEYVGGGILIMNGSSPTIEKNIIANNSCHDSEKEEGWGGGIAVYDNSSANISSNKIINNSADIGGGIVVAYNSNAVIENNIIYDNNASDTVAGIAVVIASDATIKGNEIYSNNAVSFVCGILIGRTSAAVIEYNSISNLQAVDICGGITVAENSNSSIKNNTIELISADLAAGILAMDNSELIIENNNIRNNTAKISGGGILLFEKSKASVANNVIESNNGADFGGGIGLDNTSALELSDPDNNIYNNNKPKNIHRQ
jgi:serine/threonine protein kinase